LDFGHETDEVEGARAGMLVAAEPSIASATVNIEESGPFSNVTTSGLIFTGVIVALLQLCLMIIVFRLAISSRLNRRWRLNFSRPDVVAVVFSAVHKSLTLGVPVLKVVFSRSPILPLLSTPLLMYHPLQIVLGGLAAPLIKTWVLSPNKMEHQIGKEGLPLSEDRTKLSSSVDVVDAKSAINESNSSKLSSLSSAIEPQPPQTLRRPVETLTSSKPGSSSTPRGWTSNGLANKKLQQERFIQFEVNEPL
jgi:hypothetical protein